MNDGEIKRRRRAKVEITPEQERARAERARVRAADAERRAALEARAAAAREPAAIEQREKLRAKQAKADRAEARRLARKYPKDGGPLKVELGKRSVPDPEKSGERVQAWVNLAEHPLEMMRARHRLDDAHYEAGVRYRAIYERAMIGPGRGIDPTKMKVDGGRLADPLSDDVAAAHIQLTALARSLGLVGQMIVNQVAGQGITIAELAGRWPGTEATRVKQDYLMLRLKEALDVLAEEVWGARGPARGRIAGFRSGE